MNKQTLALKPCPFCGGEAEFMPKVPPTIRCAQCSTEMVVGISSLHHFTANVWNARPLPPRGEPTEDFARLAEKYEKAMLRDAETISKLKMEVNNLRQKLEKLSFNGLD